MGFIGRSWLDWHRCLRLFDGGVYGLRESAARWTTPAGKRLAADGGWLGCDLRLHASAVVFDVGRLAPSIPGTCGGHSGGERPGVQLGAPL